MEYGRFEQHKQCAGQDFVKFARPQESILFGVRAFVDSVVCVKRESLATVNLLRLAGLGVTERDVIRGLHLRLRTVSPRRGQIGRALVRNLLRIEEG